MRVLARLLPVLLLTSLVLVPLTSAQAALAKCLGVTRTIQGNNNANTLNGTAARNVILGLGGNDRIFPRSGADVVCGGAGNDVINSYDGYADRISCGPGTDTVTADYKDAVSRDCERVRRIDHKPTALTLSKTSINENSPKGAIVGTMRSTDADPGDTGTFRLVAGDGANDNSQFRVVGNTLSTNSIFDYELRTVKHVRLRVDDAAGASYERAFDIAIVNVNEAPISISLDNSSVPENQSTQTVVGNLSAVDPDSGDTATFTLVSTAQVPGPDNAAFKIVGTQLITLQSFDRETKASYKIAVRATDAHGLTFDKQLTITVLNVNETPTTAFLSSSTFPEGPAGTVVGTLSTDDPDRDVQAQYFTLAPGVADNDLFTIDGSTLKTKGPFDFDTSVDHSFTVQVGFNDQFDVDHGTPPRGPVTFGLTLGDVNEAPTDIALSSSSVPENSAPATAIGTLSATDQDAGDTATYSLVGGTGSTDNASFQVDGSTLETLAPLDVETKSAYSVRVRVTDGGSNTFEKVFAITVTDANDVPSDISLSTSTIAEDQPSGSTVGTLADLDQDAADVPTFTLVAGAGSSGNGSFTISGTTLKTATALDFETQGSYSIRVQVDDGHGGTLQKALTVTVTNVNEAPTDLALSASTVVENSAIGTTVGTLSDTDPDAGDAATYTLVPGPGSADNASFTISTTALKTAVALDFETKSSYAVRVRVTDGGANTFEKALTITVTNVNEAPTNIALSASTVAENSASGTTVGTLSDTDQDAGDSPVFTLVTGTGSTDNASFTISGTSLHTAVVPDFETKASYSIRVQVSDGHAHTFQKVFTITVTNVNEAPTNIALSASRFAENAAVGTTVGTLSATDPDAGDTRTFLLVAGSGSTGNASFTITGTTLKTAVVADFEAQASYSVRIRVTDHDGLSFEKAFTITVTNVNEAPNGVSITASSVAENMPAGTTVGTVTATDADAGAAPTVALVAGAVDDAKFTLSAGVLKTAAVFNFEAKASYSIQVRATDAGGLTFTKTLTVTVTNVNEAPTAMTLSSSSVAENASIGTTVGTLGDTDPDTGDSATYTVLAAEDGAFTISGSSLRTAITYDAATKSSYSVTVRVTDGGGKTFDKTFAITITPAA
ncbi:MAG: cadherin domain-containing protein [Marmoricola sp.]